MRKLFLLILCLGMAACGYAYYQDTLAISGPEDVPQGQGIVQAFCDRNGNSVGEIVLFPAVYQDFDPAADKVGRYWNPGKITGAQDHILRVTNRGTTDCYFRTYVAFENNGNVFDKLITVNWADGFTVTPIEGDLILPADATNVSQYRVYLVTTAAALKPGKTAEPLLQLYLASEADNDDLQALGGDYTVRAVTEAVWQPSADHAEYGKITLDLLGEPTLAHAQALFTTDAE